MLGAMLGRLRIDRHAAYGVDDTLRGVVVMMVVFWRHRPPNLA